MRGFISKMQSQTERQCNLNGEKLEEYSLLHKKIISVLGPAVPKTITALVEDKAMHIRTTFR